jgi:DNA-binding response OmpR family regulator
MVPEQRSVPVIVLMDKDSSNDQAMIRQWFEDSRFATYESSNVFEALEQLSDFTIRKRPDVVLLDVDCCEDDLSIVREVSDLPVMALSGKAAPKNSNGRQSSYRSFGQVVSQLNEMIPQ